LPVERFPIFSSGSGGEARGIAANIAKLPELLLKKRSRVP
jgi:hypothetical protein